MVNYIVRRLLVAIPLVLALVTIVFVLLRTLVPGDPAQILAGETASLERIQQIRIHQGLDKPLAVQFGIFLLHLAQGDLGRSSISNQLVTERLWEGPRFTAHDLAGALRRHLGLGTAAGDRLWALAREGIPTWESRFLRILGRAAPHFEIDVSWATLQSPRSAEVLTAHNSSLVLEVVLCALEQIFHEFPGARETLREDLVRARVKCCSEAPCSARVTAIRVKKGPSRDGREVYHGKKLTVEFSSAHHPPLDLGSAARGVPDLLHLPDPGPGQEVGVHIGQLLRRTIRTQIEFCLILDRTQCQCDVSVFRHRP